MRYLRGLICFWLILSTPLLGMTGFAQGAFLCLGDGGRIGVETEACIPHRDSSVSSSDHKEPSSSADCEDEDFCGACIDIPLPSGAAISRLLRSARGTVLRNMMVCVMPHAEPIVSARQAPGEYSSCPQGDGVIASRRTIVLLI